MVVCNRCRNENPRGSKYCNSCGSRLEHPEDRPPPPRIGDEAPCPRCGAIVPPYMSFCPHCVFPIRPEPSPSRKPARRACPRCGKPLAPGLSTCAACVWEDKVTQDDFYLTPGTKSRIPVIVGILLIAASSLSMVSFFLLIGEFQTAQTLFSIDLSGFMACCGAIVVTASLTCFAGAILSFKRTKPTYVVLAAAIGILGVGPLFSASFLSLVALILAAVNMGEYD